LKIESRSVEVLYDTSWARGLLFDKYRPNDEERVDINENIDNIDDGIYENEPNIVYKNQINNSRYNKDKNIENFDVNNNQQNFDTVDENVSEFDRNIEDVEDNIENNEEINEINEIIANLDEIDVEDDENQGAIDENNEKFDKHIEESMITIDFNMK
jgi:paraquat-inducible protein B